ncbi:autoinducer binding domain-containing protein [Henriciella sp. AS95]|uniref:helix-turn-helix transcriptional regulator n=1 Tax=Henriciella sp. AS95 TaxID=3135782 RepID=UPI003178641B
MKDKLVALLSSPDVPTLRNQTSDIFRDLGFDGAFYLTPVSKVRVPDGRLANHGFTREWEALYRSQYYAVDPLPELAVRTPQPIVWHRLDRSKLSGRETEYMDRLPEWGMEQGVAVAAFGPAARIGIACISRPNSKEAGENPDTASLQIATQISFLRYCALSDSQLQSPPELSPRELEVLHAIAHGRSKATIAANLNLSKDTVDTYVKRLYVKLGVSDRGEAVAQAVAQGLFSSVDVEVSPELLKSQPTTFDD